MSDQQAPTEETPDVPAPIEGHPETTQPEVDYQKRYTDLQPEYTRATQRLSQMEQALAGLQSDDPDTRSQAAQALGIELAEDDTPQEYVDPNEARLAALEARFEQQTAAQQEAALNQHVDRELSKLPDLDAQDTEWVLARAMATGPGEDGMPQIAKAHQDLQAWEAARQQKWAQSKKRAPHVSPAGQAGTQVPENATHAERVSQMMENLQAFET